MAITLLEMTNRLLRRAGYDTISTLAGLTSSVADDCFKILEDNYRFLFGMAPWRWRQYREQIITEAPYTTGTAASTEGTTQIDPGGGASWAFTATGSGRKIEIDDLDDVFAINSYTVGPPAHIDVYELARATDASSTYTIFRDEYTTDIALTSIYSAVISNSEYARELDIVTPEEFYRRKFSRGSAAYTCGIPRCVTMFGLDTTRVVALDPPPLYALTIDLFGYRETPAVFSTPPGDTTVLFLPDRFVSCLEQMALADIYRDIKEDARARGCYEKAKKMQQEFLAELDVAAPQAGMWPLTSDRVLQASSLPRGGI